MGNTALRFLFTGLTRGNEVGVFDANEPGTKMRLRKRKKLISAQLPKATAGSLASVQLSAAASHFDSTLVMTGDICPVREGDECPIVGAI